MSSVSRPLRRPKPVVPAPLPAADNVFDDGELDDLQPATTSVQLANAMRASISNRPKLHPVQHQPQQSRRQQQPQPAQRRQPVQQAEQYDEYDQHEHEQHNDQYEQQQQQPPEEESYDGEETTDYDYRSQHTAFTFIPPQRPARTAASSYSASSSSSRPALTPTSIAAFDPLTTPSTRTAASRAIKKRSSVTLPTPAPHTAHATPASLADPSASTDPFDAIDPPPSYDAVLASDDVIAAQFSGLLALEPPTVDAAHIRRVVQQEQREDELVRQQERMEVEEEVNAIMRQAKLPVRAARQSRRAAVQQPADEYEEQHGEQAEELKRSAPARRQHPRYAMRSEEEEDELRDDVQQVQRPLPKTAQRVPRGSPRAVQHEEEVEEEHAADARPQQARVARKRQPTLQRLHEEDEQEWYEEQPPARSQVRRPAKKPVGTGEEKTAGRRNRVEVVEEYEEHEERKESRAGQRRLSADAATAAAVAGRKAKPVRRSVAADDAEELEYHEQASRAAEKSEKLSRYTNRPVAARSLSSSQQTRRTSHPSPSASSASASASSPSKPYRPTRVKIDALAFMQSGTPFLKYSSSYFSSPPHFRQFLLIATTPAFIQWFSPNKPLSASRVYLESVTAVTTGQATATFAKHRAAELESMSWSVLYAEGGKERSLDLTAKDKNEMSVWVQGLERMVKLVKQGHELTDRKVWRRMLIELAVVYGGNGSASQPLIDAETGQVVDVRGRQALKGAGSGDVEASLYRDLQPRLQRLEATLQKRKEEVKSAKGSSVYTVVREKVKRVEGICKVVGDALMDGNLELADQQLWLGNLELDTVGDMISSAKS